MTLPIRSFHETILGKGRPKKSWLGQIDQSCREELEMGQGPVWQLATRDPHGWKHRVDAVLTALIDCKRKKKIYLDVYKTWHFPFMPHFPLCCRVNKVSLNVTIICWLSAVEQQQRFLVKSHNANVSPTAVRRKYFINKEYLKLFGKWQNVPKPLLKQEHK